MANTNAIDLSKNLQENDDSISFTTLDDIQVQFALTQRQTAIDEKLSTVLNRLDLAASIAALLSNVEIESIVADDFDVLISKITKDLKSAISDLIETVAINEGFGNE
jgi:predicted ATPase